MDPLDVIILYGYRFKIELAFRHALRIVGSYAYHFWMMAMTPLRRVSGNQYMDHRTERYRQQVRRKLAAYHRYVQLGCIAQGLLQYLAIACGPTVWQLFRSWLRTMDRDTPRPNSSWRTRCAPRSLNFSPLVPRTSPGPHPREIPPPPPLPTACAHPEVPRGVAAAARTWHCPVNKLT